MPMTSPTGKDARLWVDASRYDLETAKALLESRRYLYVLFMCQQCLEKLLKAQVMARTVELPPRIHGLVRLAELAALNLSKEEREFLERLSLYYIQSRYPPDIQNLTRKVSRSLAVEHLTQTESLWKRLRRQLGQKK